jgi:hypothetical protein
MAEDASLLHGFGDIMMDFMGALEEVFPTCLKVKAYRAAFALRLSQCPDDAAKETLLQDAVRQYHEVLLPYYARVAARDDALMTTEPIDLMRNIDMGVKWTPALHPDTKNTIWEWISRLNEYAYLYCTGTELAGVVATAAPTPSAQANVVNGFIDAMQRFLELLETNFPACLKVKMYRTGLHVRLQQCATREETQAVSEEFVRGYHEAMEPYYARVLDKDETLLREPIEFMINIDLGDKWTSAAMTPALKEAAWRLIQQLDEYANMYAMYARVPTGMLSRIESMAYGIASQISSGSMSLSDLNIHDMAQQVMSVIGSEEMEQFAANLREGNMASNVSTMYSMISSMMNQHQM